MRSDDLPLFRWQPPSARVVAFPASRRIGKIRRVVEVLSSRSGKGFDRYWEETVSTMQRQLEAAGLAAADIDRELNSFASEVQRGLDQTARLGRRPDGGAA